MPCFSNDFGRGPRAVLAYKSRFLLNLCRVEWILVSEVSADVRVSVALSVLSSARLKSPATISRVPFWTWDVKWLCSQIVRSFMIASPGPCFVSVPDMP